jgi:hypothetical protein
LATRRRGTPLPRLHVMPLLFVPRDCPGGCRSP